MDNPAGDLDPMGKVGDMLSVLLARAASRGMAFSRADALAVGLDDHALRIACGRGDVVRVRRDGYVSGPAWRDATPEQRLALRVHATVITRSAEPPEVVTHQAALALHRLPLHGVPMDVVDLAADVRRTRVRGGVRTHPRALVPEPVEVAGVLVAPVPLAVVQVALRHGLVAGMVPLDQALRARACTVSQVRDLAPVATRPAQVACLQALAARCDPKSESPGETRSRLLLEDLGFTVRSQVRMWDSRQEFLGRVDLVVEDRVVVEFDGLMKYAGAEGRSALAREKAREDRLRRAGLVVVRLVWADLEHPERVASMIREALATARRAR